VTGKPSSPADRLVTLPEGVPALTLGYEVIKWAVRYLLQPNGPKAKQRFEFVESQVRFLLWFYAVDEAGHWLYHHAVRRLAKGSGKSPFAALISLAELCAPVRLKDFDPRVPGGCVGKPVDMPLVQIVATAESQTANTMRMVRAFAPKGSRLVREFNLDPGKTQYYIAPEGQLQQIASSYTSAEGAEATFIVGDETEHWKPSNGGILLAETLADNLAKSGSRMLTTCNSWIPGDQTVAEADWDAWVAQEEGRTRAETKILYDARMAPPSTNIADPDSVEKALDFVYHDCWWANKRAMKNRIFDIRTPPDASKRKYFNWPTATVDAWVEQQQWAARADSTIVVADKDDVVLFFDGSKSQDATALIGCRVSDGHIFTLGVWEKPLGEAGRGWTVPIAEVELELDRAFERFKVRAFFADVREWESYVHTSWPAKYADQLMIMARKGQQAAWIAWDMRSHVLDFTRAAEATLEDIIGGQITHDGHQVVARHIVNCRRNPNQWGISVRKESPDSEKKIDAGVCVIGARFVRRMLLASPEWAKHCEKKPKGRVVGFS